MATLNVADTSARPPVEHRLGRRILSRSGERQPERLRAGRRQPLARHIVIVYLQGAVPFAIYRIQLFAVVGAYPNSCVAVHTLVEHIGAKSPSVPKEFERQV
jgi:hypothetical protein